MPQPIPGRIPRTGKLVLVLLFLAALAGAVPLLRMGNEEPVLIGAILPLSGPASHLIDLRDAIDLAVEELNRWGGLNGREIRIVIEDSRSDPGEAVKTFARIEAAHHPLFYITANSNVAMALAPLAAERQVVLLGLVVSAPEFSRQNEWTYRYYTSAEYEVDTLLSLLGKQRITRLGVLYQDEPYGSSVYRLLAREFAATGGRVTGAPFPAGAADLTPQITALQGEEAIFVVGFTSNILTGLAQARQAGFDGTLFAASGLTSPEYRGRPEADGVYVNAPLIYSDTFPFAQKAREQYEKHFHRPLGHQAACGYDAVQMLAGLLTGEELSRAGVKNLLDRGFTYPGVFGQLDLQAGSRDLLFPLHPARIEAGELRYLR